jgi:carboxylesterase type B
LTAEKFLEGESVSSLANQSSSSVLNIYSLPRPDSQTSEDCLFLDVIVPKSIYESTCGKNNRKDEKSGGHVDEGGKCL